MRTACRILSVAFIAVCLTSLNSSEAEKPDNPSHGGGGGGGGSGPNYEIVPLDNRGGTIVSSVASDINEYGLIAGYVEVEDREMGSLPVVWSVQHTEGDVSTTVDLLDVNGHQDVRACGINDTGEIVGLARNLGVGLEVGLYWPTISSTPLETPALAEGDPTNASRINEQGTICGVSGGIPVLWQVSRDEESHPILSAPVALPLPEGTRLHTVGGMTDVDESQSLCVVGTTIANDGTRVAVVWTISATNEGLVPNPIVLDTSAEAHGISNLGEVSGVRRVGGALRGAVWSGGTTWTLDNARDIGNPVGLDINDAGVIVGNGAYEKRGLFYSFRAVVWTSVSADMILVDKSLTAESPFFELNAANAVSEDGHIVGHGWTGETRAYVAIRR